MSTRSARRNGGRRTDEEADVQEDVVHRGNDAPAGLGGVRGINDEHAAPEDRPVTDRKDAEDGDNAAVSAPERGAGGGRAVS